jgi:hypothetical protein
MYRGKKKYLISIIAKMGGNCMVENYLWIGQGTTILYTKRQYSRKHIMTVKSFITSFMNEKNHNWFDIDTIVMYYHEVLRL